MQINNLLMISGLDPLSDLFNLIVIALIYLAFRRLPDDLLTRVEQTAKKRKDIIVMRQEVRCPNTIILPGLAICYKPVDSDVAILFATLVSFNLKECGIHSPVFIDEELKKMLPDLPYKESEPDLILLQNQVISEKDIEYLLENARKHSTQYFKNPSRMVIIGMHRY